MTAPTQAQIEAAAKSLFKTSSGHTVEERAKAALTAAAGARESYKDGDALVTELIWEVDRAVKQAVRENGRYDTAIRHILNKHLTAAAEADEFPPDSLEGAYRQGQKLGRAAAEAHDAQVYRYVTLGNAMKRQTIERCVQAVKNCDTLGRTAVGFKEVAIAEIMALKE